MHNFMKVEGDRFNLSFDILKVSDEKRTVTGIATADNIDPAGDQVTFPAAQKAFETWKGNIREMHAPIAVGKAMSFRPVPVVYNGKSYQGIEVTAYISKGAQSTWEKVKDGTLSAFSIGGRILESHEETNKDFNGPVRVITKMILGELSLVDNPGNPAAELTIIKMAEDGTLTMAQDVESHTIFYSPSSGKIDVDNDSFADDAIILGIIEDIDTEIVKSLNNIAKGGVQDMEKENETTVAVDETVEAKAPQAPAGGNVTINIHKSDDRVEIQKSESTIEEVTEEENIVEKSEDQSEGGESVMDQDALKALLKGVVDESLATLKDEIKTEIETSVNEKLESVTKSVEEVTEKMQATEEKVEEATETVSKVAESGATKKSVEIDDTADDVDDEVDALEKMAEESFWKGAFVPMEVVAELGYNS